MNAAKRYNKISNNKERWLGSLMTSDCEVYYVNLMYKSSDEITTLHQIVSTAQSFHTWTLCPDEASAADDYTHVFTR